MSNYLEASCRRQFNQKLIDVIDARESKQEAINTLQEIQLVFEAWTDDVKLQPMIKCYAFCGIRTPAVNVPQIEEDMVEPDADIIAKLMKQVQRPRYDKSMNNRNLPYHHDVNTVTFFTDVG